eukprot:gene37651-45737_t
MKGILFLVLWAFWMAVSQLSNVRSSEHEAAVSFLLLGDWGKGGSTGSMGSSADDDELNINSTLSVLSGKTADSSTNSHDRSKADKNSKVSYQVQVAKAMGQYAASASPAPSFVLALGDNFYNNG